MELELAHGTPLVDVAVSADGTLVLSAGADGTIRVWRGGETMRTLVYDGAIAGADLSPDGTVVVAAGVDRSAAIWDVASGERRGGCAATGAR